MKFQSSKWKILDCLHREHGLDIEALEERLGLGTTTLREHLYQLIDMGYIKTEKKSAGSGRPRHFYHLTENIEKTFPEVSDSTSQLLFKILLRSGEKDKLRRTLRELMIEYLAETNNQLQTILDKH